jgi:UDP-N-acetylmuramoyl-tripeptide--D-alanyl-D-alanine ligase
MLKKILERQLKIMARLMLDKYQPQIIAITGSVGKTSTREAIACVLGSKYRVRQNIRNYNNEFGLPLSILNSEAPGRSLAGWLGLYLAFARRFFWRDRNFPEFLVLEMGIDRPGDMEYLTSIARPDVAVLTTVGQSHLEHFGDEENLAKEKAVLVKSLKPKGFAVLNYDDERVRKMERHTKARILTYGFSDKADVKALELVLSYEKGAAAKALSGLGYKLKYQGSFVPVHLPNSLGRPAVYASLAAASVGLAYGMNMVEISQSLSQYEPPKGRMRLIPGLKNTLLIDDTYNASPQSTLSAIEVAAKIYRPKNARRWAVLGDMLELGGYTVAGHQEVGLSVATNKLDKLVAVGERSLMIMSSALDAGFDRDNIFHFSAAPEAASFVKEQMAEGDILLIKGSQGMRMEKITKELLAEPGQARELLVRQDWPDA